MNKKGFFFFVNKVIVIWIILFNPCTSRGPKLSNLYNTIFVKLFNSNMVYNL